MRLSKFVIDKGVAWTRPGGGGRGFHHTLSEIVHKLSKKSQGNINVWEKIHEIRTVTSGPNSLC